jgi:hypothetical protein
MPRLEVTKDRGLKFGKPKVGVTAKAAAKHRGSTNKTMMHVWIAKS